MFLLLFVFIPPALAAESAYICPMHPHISGEEGETCPICGMTLVSKSETIPDGTFEIDPSYVHVLGVKTAETIHHTFGKDIRAFGKITPSTRLEHSIDIRAKGLDC